MFNFTEVFHGAGKLVLQAGNDYNAAYGPFRIVFTISGGEIWRNDDTGQTYHTAGRITGITYFNDAGDKIGDVTGLSADAAYAFSYLAADNPSELTNRSFWNHVQGNLPAGAVYLGSDATGRDATPEAAYSPPFDLGDDIATSSGNDTVHAGAGSDWITDNGGSDVYDGQAGQADLVSYGTWRYQSLLPQTGIVADLAAGTVTGPDGKLDQLISIEGLRGTQSGDVMRGSQADNYFLPGAGNDLIDGRGGFDQVFYRWDHAGGISANLAAGVIRDGSGGRDRIISIESVVGTVSADRFVDTVGAQRLEGEGGNDRFTLSGGNDTVNGGFGADTFKFLGTAFGADRITDFSRYDGDRIVLTGADSFADLTIYDSGDNRVIALGASRIILEGQVGLALHSGDILFV